MSTQLLLSSLLVADVILCLAVIALIVIVNKVVKNRQNGLDENAVTEFRKVLDDSQAASNHLLEAMNESRKALKEIIYALDEKEGKLRALVEESKNEYEKLKSSTPHTDSDTLEKGYEEVIAMVKEGLTKKEISQKLDLPEGEVDLIIDLEKTRHRVHNENI